MLGNKTLASTLLVSMLALTGLVSVNVQAADINLVATQDGAPLNIKKELFDTPEAKQF